MKKFFASILAFIYLSTSTGATVHLHYCMGKLMSWGLTSDNNKNCRFCKLPPGNKENLCKAFNYGCCKDEHKQISIGKDQKNAEFVFRVLKTSFATTPVKHTYLPDFYPFSSKVECSAINAPPGIGKVPVFIRNCSFLI